MLHQVRISLHPCPTDATIGPNRELRGLELATLVIPHEAMRQTFSISFEECYDQLERLPRMFIEPDGSFVWPIDSNNNAKANDIESSHPQSQWDGQLFDRNGKLLYLDAVGSGPRESFEEILKILGWPATPVMIQLSREAVFLELDEFYRYAALKME
jgi:hypothetical protein